MNGSFLISIRNGERFMVSGLLEHALASFERARDLAQNQAEKSLAWARIGLTYLGLRESLKADDAFALSYSNAKASGDQNRILEADRNEALMWLEKGDAETASRKGLIVLGVAEKMGRLDIPAFVHVVTRAQIRLHKAGKLDRFEAFYWLYREIVEYLLMETKADEVSLRTWRTGIYKSHQEMYRRLLVPFAFLVNFHRVRKQVKRHVTIPL